MTMEVQKYQEERYSTEDQWQT